MGYGVSLPDNAAHLADLLDVPLGLIHCVLLLEADARSASASLNAVGSRGCGSVLVGELGSCGKGGGGGRVGQKEGT